MPFSVVDEAGTAGADNITITPASGTIQGGATLVISANNGAASLVCDGNATNWAKTVN